MFTQGWYLGATSPGFNNGSTSATTPTYITELGTTYTDAAGVADTGVLDLGHHYTAIPVLPDASASIVTPLSIPTSPSTQVEFTVTPKDISSNDLGPAQNVVATGAIYGYVKEITDMGDGKYRIRFQTSGVPAESDVLTINVNGVVLSNTVSITW